MNRGGRIKENNTQEPFKDLTPYPLSKPSQPDRVMVVELWRASVYRSLFHHCLVCFFSCGVIILKGVRCQCSGVRALAIGPKHWHQTPEIWHRVSERYPKPETFIIWRLVMQEIIHSLGVYIMPKRYEKLTGWIIALRHTLTCCFR